VAAAEQRVEASEAQLNIARAAVEAQSAAIGRRTIVSPVSGTVIRTFDEEGELCRKGVPIALITDDSKGRWVEGFVNERYAAKLQPGQPANVEIVVGSGDHAEAEIQFIGLSTNSLGRDTGSSAAQSMPGASELVWVKLRLLDQKEHWLPGNSARAVICTR
jgi:multidrug resistance efflux pump